MIGPYSYEPTDGPKPVDASLYEIVMVAVDGSIYHLDASTIDDMPVFNGWIIAIDEVGAETFVNTANLVCYQVREKS